MSTFGSITKYSDMIFLADDDTPKNRHTPVFAFDGKGNIVSGIRQHIPTLVRKRIAVRSDLERTLADAAPKLKARFEPRLFSTNEVIDFRLELRVDTTESDPLEVAKAHWHPDYGPEDYFYICFEKELRRLLDISAERNAGTIDQRIAKFRDDWTRELSSKLSNRFKLKIKIRFDVDAVAEEDIVFSLGEDVSLYANFKDRIDTKYPFSIEMRLRPVGESKPGFILARDVDERNRRLTRQVETVCVEDIPLYCYWYDVKAMQQALEARLNLSLADYGHQIRTLSVTRPWDRLAKRPDDDRLPPSEERNLTTARSWRDSRGNPLEFHAEGIARITVDGAGLYDRAGRPRREEWFDEVVDDALKSVLAGKSITDIDEDQIVQCNRKIEEKVRLTASQVGLSIDLYFGEVDLPNNDWLKARRVEVKTREYVTAHPTISGEFSIDMQVRFVSRKALTPFLRGRLGQSADEIDRAIRDDIRGIASEAAEIVMKKIDPNEYFAGFSTWDKPVSSLGEPGEEEGQNRVTAMIKKLLQTRHDDQIELVDITYHRADSALEKLRDLIGHLANIKYDFQIDSIDILNSAYDRKATGYVKVVEGHPNKVVQLLKQKFQERDIESLRADIVEDLRVETQGKLSSASPEEVASLVDTMTWVKDYIRSDLRDEVKAHLVKRLAEDYGLVVSNIAFALHHSEYESTIRETEHVASVTNYDIERQSLELHQQHLLKLMHEKNAVSGTDADSDVRRENFDRQIDRTRKDIADLLAQRPVRQNPHLSGPGGEYQSTIQRQLQARKDASRKADEDGPEIEGEVTEREPQASAASGKEADDGM